MSAPCVTALEHTARALLAAPFARDGGQADAARVIGDVSPDAWPTNETRRAAQVIAHLLETGADFGPGALVAACMALETPVAEFAEVATDMQVSASLNPARDAAILEDFRRETVRAEAKKAAADRLANGGDLSPELLATLTGDAHTPGTFTPDLANWRELAKKPERWMFLETIPENEASLFVSPGNVGKTTLARGVALSGRLGRALFPAFRPSRKMRVLVLSAEDSIERYLRGLIAFAHAHDIPQCEMDMAVKDGLFIRAKDTRAFLKQDRPGGPIEETGYYSEVKRFIRAKKIDLLVVDTVRKHYGLQSENDNYAAGVFMVKLAELVSQPGQACIALHHTGKFQEGAKVSARGASAFQDEARSTWILTPSPEGVQAVHDRNSYGPKHEPVDFRFSGAALVQVNVNRDPAVLVPWIQEYLTGHPGALVTTGGLRTARGDAKDMLRTIVRDHHWADADAVLDAVESGLQSGRIIEVDAKRPGNRAHIKILAGVQSPSSLHTAHHSKESVVCGADKGRGTQGNLAVSEGVDGWGGEDDETPF